MEKLQSVWSKKGNSAFSIVCVWYYPSKLLKILKESLYFQKSYFELSLGIKFFIKFTSKGINKLSYHCFKLNLNFCHLGWRNVAPICETDHMSNNYEKLVHVVLSQLQNVYYKVNVPVYYTVSISRGTKWNFLVIFWKVDCCSIFCQARCISSVICMQKQSILIHCLQYIW